MADLSIETSILVDLTVAGDFNRFNIAGIDEAGRGALAGPVVAAAVILPMDDEKKLKELASVNDSKQLTPRKRQVMYQRITQNALSYGIGLVPADTIDKIGIIPATKQAMYTAVSQLNPTADMLLIDGRIRLTKTNLPQQAIIRGDSRSLSIAAASILAKVTRDRHMIKLDKSYADYGLAQHKGYGTKKHMQAIAKFGPCPIHRHSFSPIRKPLL